MTHNTRPIQPLSGRPVWYNVHEPAASEASQRQLTMFTLLLVMVTLTQHH